MTTANARKRIFIIVRFSELVLHQLRLRGFACSTLARRGSEAAAILRHSSICGAANFRNFYFSHFFHQTHNPSCTNSAFNAIYCHTYDASKRDRGLFSSSVCLSANFELLSIICSAGALAFCGLLTWSLFSSASDISTNFGLA